jgi:hypothetical protein
LHFPFSFFGGFVEGEEELGSWPEFFFSFLWVFFLNFFWLQR